MRNRVMLLIIFVFLTTSAVFAGWQIEIVDETSSTLWCMDIGDGDNDILNEIYASSSDGYVYRYKWNGIVWEASNLGNPGSHWMIGVAVGDGNADSLNEVYGSNYAMSTYQYVWNGTLWDRTNLGEGGRIQTDVGDGDNDGSPEVYGVKGDSLVYCYKWNGVSWDESNLGPTLTGAGMVGVLVGDGDDDGDNEVYGFSNSGLYKFEWNGASWKYSFVDSLFKVAMNSLTIGDGDNDGEDEIYAVGSGIDSVLYQFKWNGSSWGKTPIDTLYGIRAIAVGDGNRDGENEVYTGICQGSTSLIGKIYQYKWNGVSWDITDMGRESASSIIKIIVNDGDNDGKVEVYSNLGGGIYKYVFKSVPVLSWTGDYGFVIDGINPDTGGSGDTFEFRVSYTDSNNFPPLIKELQVDLDDNGTYEAWEKFSMYEVDTIDTIFNDGKNYTKSFVINYSGDGILNYKFIFRNVYDWAIGDPINDHSFTILQTGIKELENRYGFITDVSLLISPNPFSNMTNIKFNIGYNDGINCDDFEIANSYINIYSITGRLMRRFLIPALSSSASSIISWDGKDEIGNRLEGGIYFVKLETQNHTVIKKVILLK